MQWQVHWIGLEVDDKIGIRDGGTRCRNSNFINETLGSVFLRTVGALKSHTDVTSQSPIVCLIIASGGCPGCSTATCASQAAGKSTRGFPVCDRGGKDRAEGAPGGSHACVIVPPACAITLCSRGIKLLIQTWNGPYFPWKLYIFKRKMSLKGESFKESEQFVPLCRGALSPGALPELGTMPQWPCLDPCGLQLRCYNSPVISGKSRPSAGEETYVSETWAQILLLKVEFIIRNSQLNFVRCRPFFIPFGKFVCIFV